MLQPGVKGRECENTGAQHTLHEQQLLHTGFHPSHHKLRVVEGQ
jgi:hypothetical protein